MRENEIPLSLSGMKINSNLYAYSQLKEKWRQRDEEKEEEISGWRSGELKLGVAEAEESEESGRRSLEEKLEISLFGNAKWKKLMSKKAKPEEKRLSKWREKKIITKRRKWSEEIKLYLHHTNEICRRRKIIEAANGENRRNRKRGGDVMAGGESKVWRPEAKRMAETRRKAKASKRRRKRNQKNRNERNAMKSWKYEKGEDYRKSRWYEMAKIIIRQLNEGRWREIMWKNLENVNEEGWYEKEAALCNVEEKILKRKYQWRM